jgi:hypothetical protein
MKTTADVPPSVASEFSKTQRPSAIADATGSPGYTETKAMQKGKMAGKSKGQFGLPKSPGKGPPMQMGGNGPPPIRLHVTMVKDTDKDKM